jgi:microcystin-dependent protein
MATITATKGYNNPTGWISGEEVTPAKLNLAQTPSISISDIVNADISASAAIEGSKLSSSAQASLVPAGAVMAFAMNSAPAGWLSANGDAVSRSTYAALFTAIGTSHGVGDGSTTFNLPDLRGIFVRGSGSQTISGITYNKTFAGKEGDAFQGHYHGVTSNAITNSGSNTFATGAGDTGAATITVTAATTDGSNGTPRTASETRPANVALLYCVKF